MWPAPPPAQIHLLFHAVRPRSPMVILRSRCITVLLPLHHGLATSARPVHFALRLINGRPAPHIPSHPMPRSLFSRDVVTHIPCGAPSSAQFVYLATRVADNTVSAPPPPFVLACHMPLRGRGPETSRRVTRRRASRRSSRPAGGCAVLHRGRHLRLSGHTPAVALPPSPALQACKWTEHVTHEACDSTSALLPPDAGGIQSQSTSHKPPYTLHDINATFPANA